MTNKTGQVSGRIHNKRVYLVKEKRACWYCPYRSLQEAIKRSGI